MILQRFAIFCLGIAQLCLSHAKVSGSGNPISDYLRIDPDTPHELVDIRLSNRQRRDAEDGDMPIGQRMEIAAFGKNISLWLNPPESVIATADTRVYYGNYSPESPSGVRIEQRHGLMEMVGKILEDPAQLASLTIGKNLAGQLAVNGMIGSHRLVVRSLPRSVVQEYARKRRSIDVAGRDEGDSMDGPSHVVHVMEEDPEEHRAINAINGGTWRKRIARSTGGIPYVLYPKVLIVIDYSIFKEQGRDIYGLLEYILAFMNGVDLKYRELRMPRIQFFISGILIAEGGAGLPFIWDNRSSPESFDVDAALSGGSQFFWKIRDSIPLESYDIAFGLTRLTMHVGANISANLHGEAYLGSVCKIYDESVSSLGLAVDDGAFFGVDTMAHEIGHILGLEDEEHESWECDFLNGFIMARYPVYSTNSSSFSTCSLKMLQYLLDNQEFTCLYTKPEIGDSKILSRLVPGRMKSLEEQCSAMGLHQPCIDYNNDQVGDVCHSVKCLNGEGMCQDSGRAAADGTICSDENEILPRYCIHNQCTDLSAQ